jgi:hypothetical protein
MRPTPRKRRVVGPRPSIAPIVAVCLLLLSVPLIFVFWRSEPAPRTRGADLTAEKGCLVCHPIDPDTRFRANLGPTLEGMRERAAGRVKGQSAEVYVRESIVRPKAYVVRGYSPTMPALDLPKEDMAEMVDYILTL